MTPQQDRALREIANALAASDPRLARRLSGPVGPPESDLRELVVVVTLLAWLTAGFTPLALGLASSTPWLFGVGLVTAFVAAPVAMFLTLRWVRVHGFVRFRFSR